MNFKLKTLFDFIKTNDTIGYFKDWTNNQFRDHIWFSKEKNKTFFYYMVKGQLFGIIEFYREHDYKTMVQKVITGLSKKNQVKSIKDGKVVFVHNIFAIPNVNYRDMLQRFKKYLKEYSSIYWWKLKNNKILLCHLHRRMK